MAHPRPKHLVYDQLARIGGAVSAPRRLELLDLLAQSPRTVEALAAETGMSVANTSQHLKVLRASGLVSSSKEGLYVTYELASPAVSAFYLQLRRLAEERLGEVDRLKARFFADTGALEGVTAEELAARVERGEVLLLDVRPQIEFEAAHIAGAVSIPIDQLGDRLGKLPKKKPIVAYCRGPYCVYAVDAVKLLRERGFRASRLESGVPEWKARGLPVDP